MKQIYIHICASPALVGQIFTVPGSESKVVPPRQKQTVGVIRVKLGSGPARELRTGS